MAPVSLLRVLVVEVDELRQLEVTETPPTPTPPYVTAERSYLCPALGGALSNDSRKPLTVSVCLSVSVCLRLTMCFGARRASASVHRVRGLNFEAASGSFGEKSAGKEVFIPSADFADQIGLIVDCVPNRIVT